MNKLTSIDKLQALADAMLGSVDDKSDANTTVKFLQACTVAVPVVNQIIPTYDFTKTWIIAMSMKALIGSAIDDAQRVRTIALANGFLLPDDVFSELEVINRNRNLFGSIGKTEDEATELLKIANELVGTAALYDSGKITFDRNGFGSQLSHFEFTVAGIKSDVVSDPLAELLGYQPDADAVKRKRALDSLSRLDFTKRRPYILFIADDPISTSGAIICWQKMRDAAGYTISRRNTLISNEVDKTFILHNDQLIKLTSDLQNNAILISGVSFYDWLTPDGYFAIHDGPFDSDRIYTYTIEAFRKTGQATFRPFDVDVRSLFLDTKQLADLQSTNQDPYSFISNFAYGVEDYGWVIAGVNVANSIKIADRLDRRVGFLGSNSKDIAEKIDARTFVIPNDMKAFRSIIENMISSYGVPHALSIILDGVGATNFISGKDDPLGFKPSVQSVESVSGGLAKILGAVDPDTALFDPKKLLYGVDGNNANLRNGIDIGEQLIDVTSFDGIGKFMKTIRKIYDVYPSILIS